MSLRTTAALAAASLLLLAAAAFRASLLGQPQLPLAAGHWAQRVEERAAAWWRQTATPGPRLGQLLRGAGVPAQPPTVLSFTLQLPHDVRLEVGEQSSLDELWAQLLSAQAGTGLPSGVELVSIERISRHRTSPLRTALRAVSGALRLAATPWLQPAEGAPAGGLAGAAPDERATDSSSSSSSSDWVASALLDAELEEGGEELAQVEGLAYPDQGAEEGSGGAAASTSNQAGSGRGSIPRGAEAYLDAPLEDGDEEEVEWADEGADAEAAAGGGLTSDDHSVFGAEADYTYPDTPEGDDIIRFIDSLYYPEEAAAAAEGAGDEGATRSSGTADTAGDGSDDDEREGGRRRLARHAKQVEGAERQEGEQGWPPMKLFGPARTPAELAGLDTPAGSASAVDDLVQSLLAAVSREGYGAAAKQDGGPDGDPSVLMLRVVVVERQTGQQRTALLGLPMGGSASPAASSALDRLATAALQQQQLAGGDAAGGASGQSTSEGLLGLLAATQQRAAAAGAALLGRKAAAGDGWGGVLAGADAPQPLEQQALAQAAPASPAVLFAVDAAFALASAVAIACIALLAADIWRNGWRREPSGSATAGEQRHRLLAPLLVVAADEVAAAGGKAPHTAKLMQP